MPELPEVETTLRGIAPFSVGQMVVSVVVRNASLRWPVPDDLNEMMCGHQVLQLTRRGKYLLWQFGRGHLLIHLGMSGRLSVVDAGQSIEKHDHVDIVLSNGFAIRYTDPRRFGAVLWVSGALQSNKLLKHLGPEPLAEDFDVDYLCQRAKSRKLPIKSFVMDSKVVVGVGNIYANEALFMSGIHPLREAGSISRQRMGRLVQAIKSVLALAITAGGTTLKDFLGGDGKPGYFKQKLQVYGRAGEPCNRCTSVLKEVRVAQRSSVYCPLCQR